MSNLTAILHQVQKERVRLASQLERLNNALSALNAKGSSRRGKVSTAGRAKIAAAQRARWPKVKAQKVIPINTRKRRKLSAAALAHIRAAQKARWAKWRREQRKSA